MKRIVLCLFITLVSSLPLMADIFDDVENSKYSPIMGKTYNVNVYKALIVIRENGRATWSNNFTTEEENILFSGFIDKTVYDYVDSLNIPLKDLKNKVLPDFTWYDSEKNLVGDAYWNPDLNIYVIYVWARQGYNKMNMWIMDEDITSDKIREQVHVAMNTVYNNIKYYKYLGIGILESKEPFEPEIAMYGNPEYIILCIYLGNRYLYICLTDYENDGYKYRYKYNVENDLTHEDGIKIFDQNIKFCFEDIGILYDTSGKIIGLKSDP